MVGLCSCVSVAVELDYKQVFHSFNDAVKTFNTNAFSIFGTLC